MSANHDQSVIVAVYGTKCAAETAVHELEEAGVPLSSISLMGRSEDVREAAEGHWNIPASEDRGLMHHGRLLGLKFGAAFGFVEGMAVLFVPGIGPNWIFGPLAGMVIGGLLGLFYGIVAGHFEAMDVSCKYRARLVTGQFLMAVACSNGEGRQLKQMVRQTHPREIEAYPVS